MKRISINFKRVKNYKTKFLSLLVLFLVFGLKAQETSSVTVDVTNIKNDEGVILIALYDSEENWLGKAYMGHVGEIKNGGTKVIFENVPIGIYGVSLFHDENNNGKMDMRFGFIPKEKYACSNQARGSFGPPLWKDAKFQLDKNDKELTIKL